jgi:hypothetical protein
VAQESDANVNAGSGIGVKPWLLVAPLLVVAIFFMPTTIVITAGMLPTIVARVVDTSPGRRLTLTVACFNLVGCLYFLDRIAAMGNSISDVPVVLSNSFGWFFALVGAGIGWIVFGCMPAVIAQIARTQTAVRLRRITGDQERLVKEWGETVRGIYGVQVAAKEEGEE